MVKSVGVTAKEFRAGLTRLGVNTVQFSEVSGISFASAARYARDGVPQRSTEFIRTCMADKARFQESTTLAMSVQEFTTAFAASGMTWQGFARATGFSTCALAKWKKYGVPRGSAGRVRDVLSRPQDFPEAMKGWKEIDAEAFKKLTARITVGETVQKLGAGITKGMVMKWRARGVPRQRVAHVKAVLGDDPDAVVPLRRLDGESLRTMMAEHDVSAQALAFRVGVGKESVLSWLRIGVHESKAELVAAHVRGEDAPQVRKRRVNPVSVGRRHTEYVPGDQVRALIEAAGVGQIRTAALLGVAQATVSRWVCETTPLMWVEQMSECEHEALAAGARRLLEQRKADS